MRINCSAGHIHVILGQICAGCLLTVEKSTTFWKVKEAKGISLQMAKHRSAMLVTHPLVFMMSQGQNQNGTQRSDF